MPLPALLHTSGVPVAAASAEPVGGAAPRSGLLPFVAQLQHRSNWCWAAVSASIAGFYAPDTPWTQCRIADAELGRGDCCSEGGGGVCDIPWYLHRALARVGHLHRWVAGTLTFSQVAQSIDAGDPLCARIAWFSSGAHFVTLYGYIRGAGPADPNVVWVSDPRYGNSDVPFLELRDGYREAGIWTHSYLCA